MLKFAKFFNIKNRPNRIRTIEPERGLEPLT